MHQSVPVLDFLSHQKRNKKIENMKREGKKDIIINVFSLLNFKVCQFDFVVHYNEIRIIIVFLDELLPY